MATEKNSYKDTLNLPRTTFDMKANLLAKEPAMQQAWRKDGLYQRIREARDGAERFILHDGPPYANGNIHMGTALNKVLKDMVVRIKTMEGMDSPYVPGWDCHGLPIEAKVMEELGSAGRTMSPLDIRRSCRKYAEKYVAVQSEQFQRLGVIGEFDRPYMTMDPQYEAAVLEVFARLCEQGIVYKQLKPVHWSIENRTALADAELEYYDRQDSSVYVLFHLAGAAERIVPHKPGDRLALVIWTTTPWTLPANLAVAVHPDFTYAAVHAETGAGVYTVLIARERVEAVIKAVQETRPGWLTDWSVTGTMTGKEMVDAQLQYDHPLVKGKVCPVVGAPYVTLEDGTGLVHTAPGHGMEDYGTALKCGLEIYCPVQADGTFDKSAPSWLVGMKVWDANPRIVDHLGLAGALVLEQKITHSYPHDWRSKTPTIFRATEQWFIAVDRPMQDGGRSLRDLAMELCRRSSAEGGVDFVPAWGRNRIAGMLESRPDWCISRQRAWGLPIPAFYNKEGRPLLTPASVRAVARAVAKHGSDAWFTKRPDELLEGYNPADDPDLKDAADFAPHRLTAGADIFDVWFESGSSWFAVAMARGLVADDPVDLYLEGSDQHRGWFQLSLLPALASVGRPPFKAIVTHGFIVDEKGFKFSKSSGANILDQIRKRGADVLRLWVASQNYQEDVRCSEELIAQSDDAYRKIRNTLRYCMGACFDFDPAHHSTEAEVTSVDRWMLMQLHLLIRDVRQAYDAYEFHRASRLLYEFCTVQASSVYFSAVKDRLYCELPNSSRRRATQTVIHQILMTLTKLLAPILPHTCQEAWEHIPFRPAAEPASVHLAMLPDYDAAVLRMAEDLTPLQPDLAQFSVDKLQPGPAWIWQLLMDLRSQGLVKLEALRQLRPKEPLNPLDAEAVFKVDPSRRAATGLVETHLRELEDLLGVGYARVEHVQSLPEGVTAEVELLDSRQRYKDCARSWKRRPDVGVDPDYPELSARDAAVMRELKKT
ncbi:MAG: isoleucine--tRNA ligase [Phycisphaerae bacterium]